MHYKKQENNDTNIIVVHNTTARLNFSTFSQTDQNFRTTFEISGQLLNLRNFRTTGTLATLRSAIMKLSIPAAESQSKATFRGYWYPCY